MLQFSANVSTLFREYDFLKRFEQAKNFGFTTVEIQDPYSYKPEEISENLHGLRCDLINMKLDGEYGLASIPGREYDFCLNISETLRYFFALNTKKVHILSGMKRDDLPIDEQLDIFVKNLDASTDCFEENNIIGLIEPICEEAKKNYFLSSFDMAEEALQRTTNKNVKLLLDIYHLHKITGDVKGNLEKYYPYSGHIQISQDPGRYEPFHPDGKIDYEYVFQFLEEKHHKDVIGLEYFPSGTTIESLQWLKEKKFM